MFTKHEGKNKQRWLRQIGWQLPKGRTKALPAEVERPCDFEPNCTYDQPWIWLKGRKSQDYADTVSC